VAAAHANKKLTGKEVLKGMLLTDEIRSKLAEVFSLKSYKIDHVVNCAMVGANEKQIESVKGMIM
jgi:2-methylcitrate dehydratase